MKTIKFALILAFISFTCVTFAAREIYPNEEPDSTPTNMSEPPFWMPSYDEFNDLQEEQKNYYLEHFLSAMEKVPSLKETTKTQLTEAAEWYQSWGRLRKKIYYFCQDQTALKVCEEIADIRLKTLDMFANQKIENREADNFQ